MASLFWCGCATERPAGILTPAPPPRAQDPHSLLGTVLLAGDPSPAQFSFQKAAGQTELAADRAGTAAGNLLAKSTSDPLLDVALGAGTLVLSPFVAAHGAIAAHHRLSADQLVAAETALTAAMQAMAEQPRFRLWLLEAANKKRPGQLVPLEQVQNLDRDRSRVDGLLEARVEELRLERSNASDTSYTLWIKTRTRLVRADGSVLYDQPAEYRSRTGLFLDWTRHAALESVADTGYRALAEHLVNQVLAASEKPLLVGAGYRRSPVSSRPADASLAGAGTPFRLRPIQRVSLPVAAVGTLGIYSTASVAHVQLQRPQTRDQAHADAMRDVDWMLDGLAKHSNPFVTLPASAAAVPISLWKQSVAAVRGLSPGGLREAEARLSQAASQTQPHQELAIELAQRLTPQTSQRVMLVKKPLPPGAEADDALLRCLSHGTLAWLPEGQTAGRYLTSQGADTALELHVLSARLQGAGGINPRLALCVEAQATLLRPRDGQSFYSCPVRYRSEARTFTEWAANDAKLFRERLQTCYRDLSTAMVDQLLRRGLVPESAQPQATVVKASRSQAEP